MKTIENRMYKDVAVGKAETSTQEILLQSAKGLIEAVTAEEVIKRMDIIKKIEERKDDKALIFEDADFNYIKQLYFACKWTILHECISETAEQLKG